MRKDGQPIIRAKLAEYLRLLKEEFSEGLILPTKDSVNKADKGSLTAKMSKMNLAPSISSQSTSDKKPGVMEVKEVKIQDRFHCSKTDLFRTFCDLERVKAFTRNSVSVYDCKQGGFFAIFSDNITGRFLNVTPYDRLEMLWRFKSWPADHYSHVALTFHEETDRTKLVIQQTGVPSQFYDNTMVGGDDRRSSNLYSCALGRMETVLPGKYQNNVRLWVAIVLDPMIFDSLFLIRKKNVFQWRNPSCQLNSIALVDQVKVRMRMSCASWVISKKHVMAIDKHDDIFRSPEMTEESYERGRTMRESCRWVRVLWRL